MKNSAKIILGILIAVIYTIVYAVVIYLSFSNLFLGLKIGLYFVFLAIIIIPLILILRKIKRFGRKKMHFLIVDLVYAMLSNGTYAPTILSRWMK